MNIKPILVFYVGVNDHSPEQISHTLSSIKKYLEENYSEEFTSIIIPSYMIENEVRVECLNPVTVSEEKFKEAERILHDAQKRVDKFISTTVTSKKFGI